MRSLRWTLLFLLIAWPCQATTYFLSNSGNNGNSCGTASGTVQSPPTPANSKLTIANAWPCLQPGDTLMVRSGVYAGFSLINTGGGTAGNPKTIQGFPGDAIPIFDNSITPTHPDAVNSVFYFTGAGASYITFKNLRITDLDLTHPGFAAPVTGFESSLCFQWGPLAANQGAIQWDWQNTTADIPHHFVLDTIEIDNMKGIGLTKVADDLQVINSHLHHNGRRDLGWYGGGNATYMSGERQLWRGNQVHDNLNIGLRYACQNSENPSSCPLKDSVIENNLVWNNFGRAAHHAITECDWDTGGYGIIIFGGTGNIIRNNVIWNNRNQDSGFGAQMGGNTGIQVFAHPSGEPSTGPNLIYNNTIVDCASPYNPVGIWLQTPGVWNAIGGNEVRNNIVYNCPNPVVLNAAGGSGSPPNLGSHNLSTDPSFANAALHDYRLAPGSGAIDAGITLANVPTDILGVSRPQGAGFDMGAYESVTDVNAYSLTRNLATVVGGSPITVSWTVTPGPGQATDWVGLVHAGDILQNFFLTDAAGQPAWAYTAGLTTGNLTISAPLLPGTYEFFYCRNDQLVDCPARSAPFAITTGPTAMGLVVRRMRWHKADTPEAVDANDPDWIEGENDSIVIQPGGKVRYRAAIGFEGVTPPAFDYYALYCTLDGSTFTRLTTSCATFPLCIGADTIKNSGDPTNRRLTMPAGYTGISGYFVVDSIDPGLTRQPTDKQQFEMEYGLTSNASTASGTALQCQPRHNNGSPLDQYLASSSLVLGLRSGTIKSGTLDSGRVR